MKLITLLYIINASLLLLHEIESAYEKEWEILKLPGGISGFLLLHIPILLLLFYGLTGIEQSTRTGLVIGGLTGFCGVIPYCVHKRIVKRRDRFNRVISDIIIYLNIPVGIALLILSLKGLTV